MSGTIILISFVVIAVVALVVILIRRAKAKSTAANATSTPASTSGALRSAISTPGEEHAPANAAVSEPVNQSTVVAAAEPDVEPEPEESDPTAVELISEGDLHMCAFDYDSAIDSYEGAVDAVTAEYGRESLEFADLLVKTEDAYLARDNESDDDLNCNDYLRALSIMERCVGVFDMRLLPVINRIAAFYLLVGKVSEAEGLLRRQQLIELRAKAVQSVQQKEIVPAAQPAVHTLVPVIAAQPNPSSPLASRIDSAPAPQAETAPAVEPTVVDAHQSLRSLIECGNAEVDKSAAAGDSARAEYDYDTAADHYSEALETAQTSFGRDAVQLVPILVRLGEVCHARDILDSDDEGDSYTDPIDRTRLALSLLVRDGGMQDSRLVPVLTNMVAFSDQTGDHFKADRYLAMIDSVNEAARRNSLR